MAVSSFRWSTVEQAATFLPNLERIIRGLLYVYIFSLPFHRLLFIERNGFIILLVLLALWCLVNGQHFFMRTPVDLPLIALVGWVGISVPFATFPAYSFQEFAKLLQQGLIFYVVTFYFRETEDRLRMMKLMIVSLAIISLFGISQFEVKPWFGPDDFRSRTYFLIQSFLSSEIWLTTYLVTLIPLSAAAAVYAPIRWHRVAAISIAGMAMACQFLTFSRAGLLALFVEAVIFASLVRKGIVSILVAMVLLVGMIGETALVITHRTEGVVFVPGETKFTTYNLEARFKVWRLGIEKMLEYPVVGLGYGKNTFYVLTKEDPSRLAADREPVPMPTGLHSTFLDIAVGSGIPAGVAYLWLMWAIWRAGLKRFKSEENDLLRAWSLALVVLVAGLFVRNLFDHMWLGTMALLFWAMVGLSLKPVPPQPQKIGSSRTEDPSHRRDAYKSS